MQISSTALKALGVAAIIVAGGLVYWLTPTSGLPPEKVIQGTFDNLQNAQSFRTSSEAQLLLNYDAIVAKNPQAGGIAALLPFSSSSPLTFSIEGAYDLTETENPAFDQTMTFRMIQEDQKIEGAIQMIAKDNLQYVQLAKAPLWGFINLQPFARKWIKITLKPFKSRRNSLGRIPFPLLLLLLPNRWRNSKKHLETRSSLKFPRCYEKRMWRGCFLIIMRYNPMRKIYSELSKSTSEKLPRRK